MSQSKKKTSKRKPVVAGKKTGSVNINRWLLLAVFITLAVLIFYPPYVRGLFFKEDIFIYHILTALVFAFIWVEKIRRRDYSFLRTPLDWAVLAYAAAYLLSLIGAVHPGEALYGFLRALNLFMVYWMVTRVVKDYQGYEKILQVLLASGAGVAAIGLLAATGYSKYPGAFDGQMISSTLQYFNSTAAFLSVLTLIGVTLWIKEENIGRKLIYGVVCFLMLLTVLGAISKGAWLILFVGTILLLIGMPGVYRWKSLYYIGVAAGAAAVTASRFIPAVTGDEPSRGLALLLLGLLIVLIGQGLWELLVRVYRKNVRITVAILLIGLTLIIVNIPSRLASITPEVVSTELQGVFDLQDSSYLTRYDFICWGMDIIKDHPIIGTGAGGWNALYHQYQDYLFYTTEVHNHFLQVWVEAGTLGFTAFMSMWVLLLLYIFRLYSNYKNRIRQASDSQSVTEKWVLNWGVASAALAFGLHAAMDFDLSLMALALVLWVLFALINSALVMEQQTHLRELKPAVNITLAVIFALLLLFCGSSFTLAFNNSQTAGKTMEQIAKSTEVTEQNRLLAEAERRYARAVAGDSWNGMYHANLAQVYAIRSQQFRKADREMSHSYYQRAVAEIKEIERLSYYDIKLRNSVLNSCARLGDIELMVHQAEGTLKITPLDINAYNALARVLWSGSEAYLNASNYEAAGKLVHKLVNLEDKMQEQLKRVNPDRLVYWQGSPLEFNAESQLNIARAHYLLVNYDKAKTALAPLAQEPNNLIWYAAALYKAGDTSQAQQLTAGLHQSLYKRYQQIIEIPVLK